MEEENRKMSTMEKILMGTVVTVGIVGLSAGGLGSYKLFTQNTGELPYELFAVPAAMVVIAGCHIGMTYYEIKHKKNNDNH